ncbi:glutamyl-tRNA amidotransferase [Actinomyces sp. 2119]|uniref:GAD-like domain-containing protein n=1 Tax=Actinomyces sp. 2119 TaxID=2321393 RepID=UPI000E6D488C|nr:GAD-like domain-containing protein [Actinomyces sp. 2119]RJF43210.1 glutamyl-tRNA amidotransferase [Actinomyces sp. 2119]
MRMSKEEWYQGWLHATPEWVDALMDNALGHRGWLPMGVGAPASAEHLEYFGGVLSASVLHLWERFGFDGFGQGRWWFTDPFRWAPVVQAWLEGTPVPFPSQRWWCLARSATGDMELWGEVSGPALTVTPVMGWLRPHAGKAARMSDPVMRERMGATTLVSASEDLDDDDTGVLVADWAIDNLGVLGADQVYGLTPAYCLTGRVSLDQVGIEDAVAHLTFLAQAQDHVLEQDFSAAAAQVAASIAADGPGGSGGPGGTPGEGASGPGGPGAGS